MCEDQNGIERICVRNYNDFRGGLAKIYEETLRSDFRSIREAYFSFSNKNVVRGLHFQKGGYQQEKIIYCISGTFIDVSVNLKKGADFGKIYVEKMTSGSDYALRVPGSFAHGIVSLSDDCCYLNLSPDPYIPSSEGGILWSSLGLNLPISNPILTDKDRSWPPLNQVLEEMSL